MWTKARRHGVSLWYANGRRFAQGFAPSMIAAAVLTAAFVSQGRFELVPATWLLLYGAGVVIGGMFSAPVVRAMGVCFMAAGIAAIVTPQDWGNSWLAIGFGGLQIGFGIHIARHHGG